MPLPVVPIAGAALVAYALRRAVRPGRTDQRAEDALDDMDEGLMLHRPKDRGQTSAAARLKRTIRFGKRTWEIDAGALARFSIRKV